MLDKVSDLTELQFVMTNVQHLLVMYHLHKGAELLQYICVYLVGGNQVKRQEQPKYL